MGRKRFYILIQIIIDMALIQLGYVLAFFMRYLGEFPEANFPSYIKLIPWITVLGLVLFMVYGLYETVYKRWSEIFSSIIWVAIFICAGNTALSFMLREFAFPRTVLVLTCVLHVILLGTWRYWAWKLARKLHGRVRVIVIGDPEEAKIIASKAENGNREIYQVTGIIYDGFFLKESRDSSYPFIGKYENLAACLDKHRVDTILVCPGLCKEKKLQVIEYCLTHRIDVNLVPDFYEILIAQARIHQVDDIPVFHINKMLLSPFERLIKRAMDLVVSFLGGVLTMPLMLVIAVLIKIDSQGPVLFQQERVGENGRIFNLYKFRTMKDHAEAESGPVLSGQNDSRITRVGRLLRFTRLDELPQFFNVLKGDMSLIGPRPERPFFVEQFNQEIKGYDYRHKLRGGITGLAQISGKYSTNAEDKLRFDLLYAKNYSPLVDLHILFHTLKVLLIRDKAS